MTHNELTEIRNRLNQLQASFDAFMTIFMTTEPAGQKPESVAKMYKTLMKKRFGELSALSKKLTR